MKPDDLSALEDRIVAELVHCVRAWLRAAASGADVDLGALEATLLRTLDTFIVEQIGGDAGIETFAPLNDFVRPLVQLAADFHEAKAA